MSGYAKSGGFVDDIKDQIEAAADKIKSGEIKVPTDPTKVNDLNPGGPSDGRVPGQTR